MMIRWKYVAVALVVGATLMGCSPGVEESTAPPSWTVEVTTPSPTPTHTWTAQEQAAIDAVQVYLAMWTKIIQDPEHEDVNNIRETAVDPMADTEVKSLKDLKGRGWHLVGAPWFEPERVVKALPGDFVATWQVTGCKIITGSYIAEADGSRVPDHGERKDRSRLRFDVVQVPDGRLLVATSTDTEGSC